MSDWLRLVGAATLLIAGFWHTKGLTYTEETIFDFINSLPDALFVLFRSLYALAALWAVGLVIAAALIGRRWRLARDLMIAGVAGWAIARFLAIHVSQRTVSVSQQLHIVLRFGNHTPQYPVSRLALVVSVVCVASPYLTRPTRRIGEFLVVSLAISSMYLGTGYPNDVLAAIVLGWGVAAAVHLAFGSPGGRPTNAQIAATLAELGVSARNVRLAPKQPADLTLMEADGPGGGSLAIKVLGRDEASAQFLAKAWRFVAYKDSGPSLFVNRRQQVEHEAYAMLMANKAGVAVPDVVVAGTAGPGAAVLVIDEPSGDAMSGLSSEELDERVIDLTWSEVKSLRERRLAHGSLNADSVLITKEGPVITSFDRAVAGASEASCNRDVAEMLTSIAAIKGEEDAVAGALRGLGPDPLIEAMPLLQPQALSYQYRHANKRSVVKKRTDKLRKLIAQSTDTEEPQLIQMQRVSTTNLMMTVGTLFAVAALLSFVGDPQQMWNTIKGADWWMLAFAFVLVMSTNIAWAIGVMGAVPIRLPLWEATEVQIAMSFATLALPGIGPTALQVRYFQKHGMTISAGVASSILSQVGYIVTQIMLFAVALLLAPGTGHLHSLPSVSPAEVLLVILLVSFAVGGIVFGIPKVRKLVVPHLKQAGESTWEVLRSPLRLTLLLSGNALAGIVSNVVLVLCLVAFGGHAAFWNLMVVNIAVSTIAGLVPIPGGNTAVGTIGLSGGLVALGIPDAIAVSTVLAYTLIGSYLSGLPGWFATRDLVNRQIL